MQSVKTRKTRDIMLYVIGEDFLDSTFIEHLLRTNQTKNKLDISIYKINVLSWLAFSKLSIENEVIDAIIFADAGVEESIGPYFSKLMQQIKKIRAKKIPLLAFARGARLVLIEYARHQARLSKANSIEFADSQEDIIYQAFLPNEEIRTVRAQMTGILKVLMGEKSYKWQRLDLYEVNPAWQTTLSQAGMIFTVTAEKNHSVEAFELGTIPCGIGIFTDIKYLLEQQTPLLQALFNQWLPTAV